MVIIIDAQGNLLAPTIPENVYQGSNLANDIILLCPLASSNNASIMFRLPNGLLTSQYFMTPVENMINESGYNAWRFTINEDITGLYGTVNYQIRLTNSQGTIVASVGSTFQVLRGVAPIPSEEPSVDTYEEILAYLSSLRGDIDNGWLVSKGILPYDSEFEYPLGVSVFDKSTHSIYTSKIDENKGNALSNTACWDKTNIQTQTDAEILNLINSLIATHNTSATAHNDRFAEKQNVLTAGDNISIENDVISADVPEVKNEYSTAEDEVYSSKYVNDNFVPLSFASRLYLTKTSSTTASLEDTAPTTSASNVLSIETANTTFDWSSPAITVQRELTTAIQLNNTNSFAIDLYFDLSRNTELTFGAKIKVSTDNGTTWNYISSNQSFGEKSYNNGFNTEDIVVFTDLATNETYDVGTLLAIEIFTKQEHNNTLTTEYYCGVEVDGAGVYSFVEFNFANVNINTNQIENGAITWEKLDGQVQNEITSIASLSFSGFVKGDVDNLYDMWKLNDDVDTSKGIAIGYFNNNNLTFVFAQKERAGVQVTDGVDASGVTVEADEVSITSPTITIVGDATLNGEQLSSQKIVSNTSVSTWVADNTYQDYDYRATITISGVTSNDIPEVIFGATEAISGNYLPIAESITNGIYIYSKVNDTITIPTIIIQKVGGV